ncbi:lactonase, 7-bladed beta-propeller family protein [Clostridium baratii str. Sullivan]|uniref:Lactonase, 7-bladed beta-propeller family protein n=1 Tax=Clostridium baratii str. Sullivan TaxID=1415775 RepID=A0A0A7FU68_9CLOT|nr:beta-propeller fold lactonase family protein [Clostridium baratii]AIY82356.1 lactonase, 7-bladed beta-propeller family protein [Clostridium baratii str. Sullivan]
MREIFLGFIGTYTKKDSNGLYKFLFDSKIGKFLETNLAFNIENPTYISLNSKSNVLFSIQGDNLEGGICSFKINNMNLYKVYMTSDSLKPPCYISNNDNFLFSANYHEGIVNIYEILDDLSFKLVRSLNTKLKDSSKMHFAGLSPNNNFLATCNLSLNKISMYNTTDFTKLYSITLKNNSGPRHLVFHNSLNIVYVLTELTAEIFTLEFDDWGFNIIDNFSIYKESREDFEGAAIHIHPSNKYIYVSERKRNSISCYKILKDGTLSLVDTYYLDISHPRDFTFTPDGKWIIIASLLENKLTSYEIDLSSGSILSLSDEIKVPEPTCVIFTNKAI